MLERRDERWITQGVRKPKKEGKVWLYKRKFAGREIARPFPPLRTWKEILQENVTAQFFFPLIYTNLHEEKITLY